MNYSIFNKTKKDGSEITCKFCHKPIWHHSIEGRIYEVGGAELHVNNCPKRAAYFKSRALDAAESRRNG